MNQDTINLLNRLNQNFYKDAALSFSESRNYYWAGWQKILPILQTIKSSTSNLKILDIGCGNGRFGLFLKENLARDFDYVGLDSSPKLLEIAENNFKKVSVKNFILCQTDLIEKLLINKKITTGNFDVIVLFGILHHIPGFALRQKLFTELEKLLNPEGVIIVTAWQFLDDPKLKSRLQNPAQLNLKKQDLEENDFILDWRRDQESFKDEQKATKIRPVPIVLPLLRYCHFTTDPEMAKLLENSNLKIRQKFRADSKTNTLNQYYLLGN